jgi:hypothetical protein
MEFLKDIRIGNIQSGNFVEIDQHGEVTIYNGGIKMDGGDISRADIAVPGTGISAGVGTLLKSGVIKIGDIIKTSFLLDITGLGSSTTDLDIIGTGTGAAYLAQITAAINGTILSGRMICLEVPAGGADDVDLYSAEEASGVFDGGIAALVETALVTAAGAWTLGLIKGVSAVPAANEYLYLCGGEAGTAAAYTAGKFLIELDGYVA